MQIRIVPFRSFFGGALAIGCAIALAGCQNGPVPSAAPATAAAAPTATAATPLAVAAVTQRAAPIEVVSLSGRNVVLDRGASAIEAGTLYQAIRVDPGAASAGAGAGTPCCSIQVDRVDATRAYGHIVDADFHEAGKFVPGSIELGAPVPLQSVVAVTAKMVATN